MRNTAIIMVTGEDVFENPFSWNLVGKNLFCLKFLGIFFFILTICIEYKFWYYKLRCLVKRRSRQLSFATVENFMLGD